MARCSITLPDLEPAETQCHRYVCVALSVKIFMLMQFCLNTIPMFHYVYTCMYVSHCNNSYSLNDPEAILSEWDYTVRNQQPLFQSSAEGNKKLQQSQLAKKSLYL